MPEYRIVSPFRPFKPESKEHFLLGKFDWYMALAMLAASAKYCGGAEVVVLTDHKTAISNLPTFRYSPRCNRLMPWILDVTLSYLESDDFDRDTWFISPDMMVMKPLGGTIPNGVDLMLLTHTEPLPIINHTQFWRHSAKKNLIKFYRQCFKRALELDEEQLCWGADTEPLVHYLSPVPLAGGAVHQHGLNISFVPRRDVTFRVNERLLRKDIIDWRTASASIAEFTYGRKRLMRDYFQRAFAREIAFAGQIEGYYEKY